MASSRTWWVCSQAVEPDSWSAANCVKQMNQQGGGDVAQLICSQLVHSFSAQFFGAKFINWWRGAGASYWHLSPSRWAAVNLLNAAEIKRHRGSWCLLTAHHGNPCRQRPCFLGGQEVCRKVRKEGGGGHRSEFTKRPEKNHTHTDTNTPSHTHTHTNTNTPSHTLMHAHIWEETGSSTRQVEPEEHEGDMAEAPDLRLEEHVLLPSHGRLRREEDTIWRPEYIPRLNAPTVCTCRTRHHVNKGPLCKWTIVLQEGLRC